MIRVRRIQTATSSLLQAAISDIKSVKSSKSPLTLPTFTTGSMKGSPRKLNHLARLIKGMTILEAQHQMSLVLKKPGMAVANLLRRVTHVLKHNYQLDALNYSIKQAWVGKNHYLKRISMHGRGRSGIKTRPSSHLKIQLSIKNSEDKDEVEMMKLVKQFKQHRLFVSLSDQRPVLPQYSIWSITNKKYLNSQKWIEPSNALVTPKNRKPIRSGESKFKF